MGDVHDLYNVTFLLLRHKQIILRVSNFYNCWCDCGFCASQNTLTLLSNDNNVGFSYFTVKYEQV